MEVSYLSLFNLQESFLCCKDLKYSFSQLSNLLYEQNFAFFGKRYSTVIISGNGSREDSLSK